MATACGGRRKTTVVGLGDKSKRTRTRRGPGGGRRGRAIARTTEASTTRPSRVKGKLPEFETLKRRIFERTALASAVGTGYCLIGFGNAVGASFALGTAGATLYLLLLTKSVEEYSSERLQGFEGVSRVQGAVPKLMLKVFEGSKLALLNERLLIPAALALMYSTWNKWGVGEGMSGGGLLLGFLTYKVGFIAQIWEEFKSSMLADGNAPQSRPTLHNVDDELDIYGKQRKPSPPE